MNYYLKYKKYKMKYLKLKIAQQTGGMNGIKFTSKNISSLLTDHNKPFELFNINFTSKEIKCINNFELNNNDFIDFSYFNWEDFNSKIFNDLLTINSNKISHNSLSQIIKKIGKIVLEGYSKDDFWMNIRFQPKNNLFDFPRWHCDGKYFKSTENQSKFVITLKGPTTLLIKPSFESINTYLQIKQEEEYEIQKAKEESTFNNDKLMEIINTYRQKFADKLKDYDVIQPTNNQGVIFFAGNNENCAIHSEPPFTEPRIFISILTGTKEQINEWKSRMKI